MKALLPSYRERHSCWHTLLPWVRSALKEGQGFCFTHVKFKSTLKLYIHPTSCNHADMVPCVFLFCFSGKYTVVSRLGSVSWPLVLAPYLLELLEKKYFRSLNSNNVVGLASLSENKSFIQQRFQVLSCAPSLRHRDTQATSPLPSLKIMFWFGRRRPFVDRSGNYKRCECSNNTHTHKNSPFLFPYFERKLKESQCVKVILFLFALKTSWLDDKLSEI